MFTFLQTAELQGNKDWDVGAPQIVSRDKQNGCLSRDVLSIFAYDVQLFAFTVDWICQLRC